MFGKTSNRWLLALVTVSVLTFAIPQAAAAAPVQTGPGVVSLDFGQLILQWAADLWQGVGRVFDASTTTSSGSGSGGGSAQAGSTNSGEQGGMIDPNG